MAETKRQFVFNEAWNHLSNLGVSDPGGDIYIVNAFSSIAVGPGDTEFIGNQIIDPLIALKLSVQINWLALQQALLATPTVLVDVMLIAINDTIVNASAPGQPRLTTLAEDSTFFVKHPSIDQRWMLNSQSVTVIKRKRLKFSCRDIPTVVNTSTGANTFSPLETRVIKISKRLRGTKTYETQFSTGGVETRQPFLKGWNFYWLCINQTNATYVNAVTANPVRLIGDRYLYFKDL